jgi:hypothetical protein
VKFVLVLALCSQTYGSCMPPLQNKTFYNSFRDCSIAGYEGSLSILKAFSVKEFEDKKLYTSFTCTLQETT